MTNVDAILARIRKNIATHGWHGMGVFGTEDEPMPPFTYTIGLTEKGWPELVILGIPNDTAHRLLSCAVDDLQERGGLIEDRTVSDQILKGLPAIYRELPPEKACAHHMIWARHYYVGRPIRTFQIVWPDSRGRFPWQPRCNSVNARNQSAIIDWRKEKGN